MILQKMPHYVDSILTQEDASAALQDRESLHGTRILLTEDNDLNAEIATELLQEEGCTVDRAKDGVDVRSRSNGSKICFWNSCDMPMPLSATVTTVSHQPSFSPGFCVTPQRIVPPAPVYLTALLTRFVQTSVRCGISA